MILNIFGNQNEITQLPYHEFNWDEQIAVKKLLLLLNGFRQKL